MSVEDNPQRRELMVMGEIRNSIKMLLVFLALAWSAESVYSAEFKSTIEYIQKTHKLWGISKVTDNGDNTITLADGKNEGYGHALGLMDKNSEWIDEITLKPKESCLLTDGHHAFITYQFIAIKDSNITFKVIDKFDARSFGDGIKKETAKFTISPYEDKE